MAEFRCKILLKKLSLLTKHFINFEDEILTVGDFEFQQRCYAKIDEICQNGVTLILVSHNTSDIERVCERSIWLDGGAIHYDATVSQTLNAYNSADSLTNKSIMGIK